MAETVAPTGFPSDMEPIVLAVVPFGASLFSLATVMALKSKLGGAERGVDIGSDQGVGAKMNALSDTIQEGAMAFLKTEYKYLAGFVTVVAIILFVLLGILVDGAEVVDGLKTAICFVFGAMLSAQAGWIGMRVATDANVKTTQAARKKEGANDHLNKALRVAFTGGSIMGFTVVGLGLFGVSILFFVMTLWCDVDSDAQCIASAMVPLAGFGFGASAIALFARVAGGIFTKAADVGADLVGKVEAGIPEDDPRNPAVIADNVGDNVGDVAGMGADLFESFVGSLIACMTLADTTNPLYLSQVALPFWLAGGGVLCSLVGFVFVRVPDGEATQEQLLHALHRGTYVSSVLVTGLSVVLVLILFGDDMEMGWKLFGCIMIGLVSGILIGEATEYCTSYAYQPTVSIMNSGRTGPATVIIQGLGVGMLSCVPPVTILVGAILGCTALGGEYGVAIAAVGMLSTLGITLATDAYGPVADNAGGIAEMAELDPQVRDTTDALDALGNTTAATGKGFAIGSAVLTALSLLAAFKVNAGIPDSLAVTDSVILSGVMFGAMLPYLFAALTMLSVRKSAGAIINEVRRQFCFPGVKESFLKENEGNAAMKTVAEDAVNPSLCVKIATESSVVEMVLPGTYAILCPIMIGLLVGPACLAGVLAGSIASGCMLGIMMSNAGGAWDNSKKYIEIECTPEDDDATKGFDEKGENPSYKIKKNGFPTIPKHTVHHDACVVGDTVGDPFKDTSGPALNILIKLMSMVSLTIAPLLAGNEAYADWVFGLIPVVVAILITVVHTCKHGSILADVEYPEYDQQGRVVGA